MGYPMTAGAGGFLPRVRAGQPCLVLESELHRDLRPGVPGAHDEHGAFLNLRWVAVLLGVELDDALMQLGRECRNPRGVERAGRHDDVLGEERVPAPA